LKGNAILLFVDAISIELVSKTPLMNNATREAYRQPLRKVRNRQSFLHKTFQLAVKVDTVQINPAVKEQRDH